MKETLSPELQALLSRFHFSQIPFDALREKFIANVKDPEVLHRITEPVMPPEEAIVQQLPANADEMKALTEEGTALLRKGELAVVVLAGGMATRFGSKVKALAPLFPDKPVRFLDAKLADAERFGANAIDLTLMTSFATDEALGKALEGKGVHRAGQFISLRLASDGSLFLENSGQPSAYATGHGDLPAALASAGVLERLRARGARSVLVMNVDNLGATIDPALLALHRRHGKPITVELVNKRPGDKGGLPVLHHGRPVLAEAFRLPSDFPHDRFGLFNTNTLWIELSAIEQSVSREFTWCVARKKVDGREAIQFERLVGELTWWHDTAYVRVPREGAESRFLPVKDTEELARSAEQIASVLRERVGMKL